MEIEALRGVLAQRVTSAIDFYERRPGSYQLIFPVFHEDGDMIDIYLQESPLGQEQVRICDFGMTLMRLSYSYEINTDSRQRIFENILINSGLENDDGNLYLDTDRERIYEGVLQFAGGVQKICNLRYWQRETVRNTFYEDLEILIQGGMEEFNPRRETFPLQDYPSSVDWSLNHNDRQFFVFGVLGNGKAKSVVISLLEFQKARLPFISLIVHDDMENLGRLEKLLLTRNADTQYPVLNDFREKGADDIRRLAGGRL